MSYVYLSALAEEAVTAALASAGHTPVLLAPRSGVEEEVASHADIFFCRGGTSPGSPLYGAGDDFRAMTYPAVAAYNAVFLERYFVHRLDITAKPLLKEAEKQGLVPVHVRQGYTRCNLVVVDGRHVITADAGLYRALSKLPGLSVLGIEPGYVQLGRHSGFLGGASGRVGSDVWFHGDLSTHPDEKKIRRFIEDCGLGTVTFSFPLRDIGSMIESDFLLP